ncbi:Histidine kinase [Hymenobacter daecheongensis DSM 21074]|uniref:Histidine kinase n=1 Tax=Hymenobacter daecheongensis DSM 21074 TaxID=1121955 RepID=A0A1M6J8M1_9BACT|nr:sensor histidine kinase [Hymenobacter daecheongensis]SHJ43058.1 Histidine kinase [Hymenobacter daecheongensis DSM 21074]
MQQQDSDRPSRFPLAFELLMWGMYVGLYKYAWYIEKVPGRPPGTSDFPYPHLIAFAGLATLYVLPYYRWLLPLLLRQRRYFMLLSFTLLYFWQGSRFGFHLSRQLFEHLAQLGGPWAALAALPAWWNLELPVVDLVSFSCVAFVRLAFDHETRRRHLEKANLALQLEQLKSQLQPHFLFNTLNSIYGLSLTGSPDTPRFILLLSELMRYVLYDSGKEYIALPEEVVFLENYFEMEQLKYPTARVRFSTTGTYDQLRVPPLLLLPLVENSFKHGRHHHSDQGQVEATLISAAHRLQFTIENDMLPEAPAAAPKRSGGIGLVNIRQRLNMYYPDAHELLLTTVNGRFRAQLTLHV